MPSPLIHLYVSTCLKQLVTPEFLLGSIAPDAIHMRRDTTWSDKAKTHFYNEIGLSLDDVLRKALEQFDDVSIDFNTGYLIHLYTDHLWRDEIYAPFLKSNKDEMSRADLYAVYYQDMAALDEYFKQVKLDLDQLYIQLEKSQVQSVNTLLSSAEIKQWKINVLNQMQTKPKGIHDLELNYFSLEEINQFLTKIIEDIPALLIRLID